MITLTKNKLDPVWNQIQDRAWQKPWNQIQSQVSDRIQWQIRDQTRVRVSDQVINQIWIPILVHVRSRMKNQIYDNHYNQK